MAGVEDEVLALDFDIACTVRLDQHDAEELEAQARQIALEVSKLFGGFSEE